MCDASFLVFFTHTFTRGTRHFFRGIYFSGKTHFVRQSFVSTLSKKRKNEAQKARKKAEAHLIRVEDWLQSLRKMWHPLYVVPGIFWSVLHNSGSCLVDGTRNGGLQRGRSSLQQNKCSQFSYVVVDYSGQKAVMKELFGVCSLCRALVILKNIFRYISSILPL